jgi:hypothetical protein
MIGDTTQFSGKLWDEERSSALQDYWPKTAPRLPTSFAPDTATFYFGQGQTFSFSKSSSTAWYSLEVLSKTSKVSFPIVYFPGWTALMDNSIIFIGPDSQGLISALVPQGWHKVSLKFVDTPVRHIGDIISLIALASWFSGLIFTIFHEKK